MIGAGKRNRRIRVEAATITKNGFNEPVKTWGPYCTAMAAVIFGSGQERRDAAQEGASAAATFVVPHNPRTKAISVEYRIQFDGSAWDIVSNVPSVQLNAMREISAVRATK